ncbi:Coenzyme F420 hydrogenase/dehydrogenase, beta subunit C-terminal domain [Bacteroides sp. GD17]|jgi:coenzyme F420-reducing hydrogenase beta subunit|uniref:Coenzyme F420 hydrogenase/dehydrogenase, beta subunit C-terminal domain n=1 Tax=Bacteroides sp. GD17 TaxID=3139826 RepID=UPI0025EC488A|nr:Coenzyme F420 hydrogenase/dehydrogenase, beta subunit C-terminal domain [uncultured Bacteroides sp.]
MNNIQIVSNALLCSNCGACKAICPRESISFKFSSLGRMYASVSETCVDCGLCTKVCPSLDYYGLHAIFSDRYIGAIKKVYVGKTTNDIFYKNAQSGGVCTTLLEHLFESGAIDCAVLCRMSYGRNIPIVESVVVNKKEQLLDCQKSCYAPVDILSVLKAVKDKSKVAIVGLPCHIQGLEALMRTSNKYSIVKYRIGLICERTLGSTLQDVMVSYQKREYVKIDWKRKDFNHGSTYYPYKTAPLVVTYKNGEEYIYPNLYRFALKDMFTSPRCRVCYDKLNVFADIVLGDPWGMSNIDWQHGESLVIVRTDLGKQLIDDAILYKKIKLREADLEEMLRGQGIQKRREQVAVYSSALQILPVKCDSYLYSQEKGKAVSVNSKKAMIEMEQFLQRERKSKEMIVEEAHRLIEAAIKKERMNKNIIIRIAKRIYRIILK